MSPSKIPVVLVTGFLGSGKTTFLIELAKRNPRRRLLFLVNEFSPTGIDDLTVAETGRPTHRVVGGSLFCECKAGEFVRLMREKVIAWHQTDQLDAVVIETSGIADPEAIGRLMRDHGLNEHFAVHRIVCIIAPKHFAKLHANLPAVRAQLQTSDLTIINKTDLSTADQISQVQTIIKQANPTTEVIAADFCQIDFQFSPHVPILPDADLATCDANPFTTETVTLANPISSQTLTAWLRELPPEILRVKGSVATDTGWLHVQHTVDSSSLTPAHPQGKSQLVLVAHDNDQAILDATAAQLRALLSSDPLL